ncbi:MULTISPECIES: hypothetical protein [Rathayibacter]|jgi:hypothetical protein|uniref:Uncharacterized protein n=2 Tax=Rathayibacter festucae TaxID=110937 RepID=A0A3Q9UX59_9MICO|nr:MULTISPECIES: hypothetical protein [Rathayibacter]AZZ52535.1 hypothetical protein C1I64_11095 [Rathayibacter festucae DSM 15932]MCJ1672223.1 hypothetical protein [Rathayibacter sp. VKM Ac-2929]MCJ1683607.1 hypothetical protein [Rathayibacter sp. VKM Ac-2928]MCJ1688857.1 hypothetical protein [Rathayibacter sp. VKM Ac-2927]MCJ1701109.1 hypothetical protein [Rathayibacter festucae]
MALRDDAEELVRQHQREAEEAHVLDPWADPETPEWAGELAAALWQGSFRPSPVYYRAEDPSHAWRGPHPIRVHHLGFGWQITARRLRAGAIVPSTVVLLETGTLWLGLGPARRPGRGLRALGEQGLVDGLQPGHDDYFAVRRFVHTSQAARDDRRLLFGVAGLAALIEDTVRVGPHGELHWHL